jgi:hypothetical protein
MTESGTGKSGTGKSGTGVADQSSDHRVRHGIVLHG